MRQNALQRGHLYPGSYKVNKQHRKENNVEKYTAWLIRIRYQQVPVYLFCARCTQGHNSEINYDILHSD